MIVIMEIIIILYKLFIQIHGYDCSSFLVISTNFDGQKPDSPVGIVLKKRRVNLCEVCAISIQLASQILWTHQWQVLERLCHAVVWRHYD